jgi:hypothetical protein
LGEGDGGVFDNSGQFNVQLFAVESVAGLPAPPSLFLLGAGLIVLATFRLKLWESVSR